MRKGDLSPPQMGGQRASELLRPTKPSLAANAISRQADRGMHHKTSCPDPDRQDQRRGRQLPYRQCGRPAEHRPCRAGQREAGSAPSPRPTRPTTTSQPRPQVYTTRPSTTAKKSGSSANTTPTGAEGFFSIFQKGHEGRLSALLREARLCTATLPEFDHRYSEPHRARHR